jgi:hypothetical protein
VNNSVTLAVPDANVPMRVNLTISGIMPRVPSARFHPENNLVFPTSDATYTFGISVPYDLTPGFYSVEWSKSGDDFESLVQFDEIYSPIKYSTIEVIRS